MINITSYLHRDELFDLISRWMVDKPEPTDADRLARIILFNQEYVSRYLAVFAAELFECLHGPGLTTRDITLKGELKDVIVCNPPCQNDRINALIRQYHGQPGRYYRETPFLGTLFLKGEPGFETYVGSTRIKRVRRLAEKCARIITDQIFSSIKTQADALAEERARRLGISRLQLVTPPEEMIEEFLEAENHILEQLAYSRQLMAMPILNINDVAGIKVISEADQYQTLLDCLRNSLSCEIVEEERHTGIYNATNLIVRFHPPADRILADELSDASLLNNLKRRGIPPGQADREFAEFVRTGEDSVCLEIIVISYKENLESEIGRCIHEDRIVEQRRGKQYRGHLAKNIEYLMEYLFTFPASGEVKIGNLPIKLWNRYLPDYFDEVMKELFHLKNRRFFNE